MDHASEEGFYCILGLLSLSHTQNEKKNGHETPGYEEAKKKTKKDFGPVIIIRRNLRTWLC